MPYTPTQKSLKQHADALALALQVMNPDAPELAEYRTSQQEEWVSASRVCQHLAIVPRTLLRWRQDGKLTPGTNGGANRSPTIAFTTCQRSATKS